MTKKHTTNVVTREEYTRHTKTLVGGCFVKLEERLTRKERVNKRTEADVRWRKSVQIFPVCGFSSEPYSVARVCETALTPPPPLVCTPTLNGTSSEQASRALSYRQGWGELNSHQFCFVFLIYSWFMIPFVKNCLKILKTRPWALSFCVWRWDSSVTSWSR